MITRQMRRDSLISAALREHHEVVPVSLHRVDFARREIDGISVREIARWIAESPWNNFNDRPKARQYFEVRAFPTRKLEDDFMCCLSWLSFNNCNWAMSYPLQRRVGEILGPIDGCDYLDDEAYHAYSVKRWRRNKKLKERRATNE